MKNVKPKEEDKCPRTSDGKRSVKESARKEKKMESKAKNRDEEQKNGIISYHDFVYRIYRLSYFSAILITIIVVLIAIDVAIFVDYSMSQPGLYLALIGFGIFLAERTMDWKLKKWGVIG